MRKKIINFRVKNYCFSASVLPIVTFFTLFILLINLGIWQIHRGDEKKRIQMEFSQRQNASPIDLNYIVPVSISKNYFSVLAEGYFDNKHNFLLDNKIYQHQIGYEVLTPFILKNSAHVILVNRGWISQGQNRKTLPFIKAAKGNVTIEGLIVWPTKTFSFKAVAENNWPQRIQTLDPKFLSQKHLQPFIIVVNTLQPYGFIPLWKAVTLQASRHYAYAVQWFSLSVTLLIAFFISHISRL
jgi:surfeit locus 1 family protein